MSSPVEVLLSHFIKTDRNKDEPVYLQIVYQFINAVKMNRLQDGQRLPGSRKIAADLSLHRKTVIAALEELRAQGWVETRPSIGTFVKNPEFSAGRTDEKARFLRPPDQAGFEYRKNFILDDPMTEERGRHYFTDGIPDYRIIPPRELVRFYAAVLGRKRRPFEYSYFNKGNDFFEKQLSYYLNLTRGFHLSEDFLLPVTGREKVFSILSQLLIKSGQTVLVSELSFFLPNMIFSQAGARLKMVPVDESGISADFIRKNFERGTIKFLYLNSGSQHPTTVPLSEGRQSELLLLAEEYDFVIIEDDHDYEFSLKKDHTGSLFRKDGGKRVIYTGVFGGFLSPGFQMNFIIAPKDVIAEGEKYLNLFGKPNLMMERALGEMIRGGDIHRYRRKSQQMIQQRKEMFAVLVQQYFGSAVRFRIPPAGLAFWIVFNEKIPLATLQEKAREKGLSIPRVCLYQNKRITALRLGFAHLNEQEMTESVELLYEAYRDLRTKTSLP